MLQRENELRLAAETQALYAAAERSVDTDWMEVTEKLQLRLINEFGFTDTERALNALRSARANFASEDPSILDLAVYLKYNRARKGALQVGDVAPNVPMTFLDGSTKQLHDVVSVGRPAVLIAGSYS
jgi:hypothetical protein